MDAKLLQPIAVKKDTEGHVLGVISNNRLGMEADCYLCGQHEVMHILNGCVDLETTSEFVCRKCLTNNAPELVHILDKELDDYSWERWGMSYEDAQSDRENDWPCC